MPRTRSATVTGGDIISKLTKAAAAELCSIPRKRQRLESLKLELEAINTALYSPRGATLSAVPTHGGGNRTEEKIVNIIDDPKREMLIRLIDEQERQLQVIESALSLLSPLERQILDAFYIGKPKTMAQLMVETNYSDVQINRIKYSALGSYAYMRGLDAKNMNKP